MFAVGNGRFEPFGVLSKAVSIGGIGLAQARLNQSHAEPRGRTGSALCFTVAEVASLFAQRCRIHTWLLGHVRPKPWE